MEPGIETRASSSDTLLDSIETLMSELSSGWSNKADSLTPPTSKSVSPGNDGVDRYDWAEHWARVDARTKEDERPKPPAATDPQQRQAPVAEDKPCYGSVKNFSRKFESPPEIKHPRVRRMTRRPKWIGPSSAESSASDVESMPRDKSRVRDLMEKPSYNYMAHWDFGFAAANKPRPLRPHNHSPRHRSQASKAEA